MLKKMRVLIVEDRPLARERLNNLLTKKHPDIEVAGEFENTASAWPVIEAGNIDGVFLDIDIKAEGHDAGLDMAYRIDRLPLPRPWVVFTTGFNEFALDAHDVHPFGYLVKPLTDVKLAPVLDRIRRALPQNTATKPTPARIEIRHKTVENGEAVWCTKFVTEDEIKFIQSNNNGGTTRVKLVHGEILDGINKTLQDWLKEKDLPNIKQIHKSHLVNQVHVDGIIPNRFREDNCYVVTFRGCDCQLPIGKSYVDSLR